MTLDEFLRNFGDVTLLSGIGWLIGTFVIYPLFFSLCGRLTSVVRNFYIDYAARLNRFRDARKKSRVNKSAPVRN